MRKKTFLSALFALSSLMMFAQGAKNIKINEVMTSNTASIEDEYGNHRPWIELANVSFSTFNVRGMYIATDKAVLNPDLTVPERVTMMSIIPNNEPRTNMGGRQHLILFLNSNPANGSLHLASTIDASAPIWIGLYEGNGVDLVDSVTIPMGLNANTTYARQKDGSSEWEIKATDAATPGIENYIQVTESKVQQIKRNDPHGFGITILSMGIVFSCLALLWIFFTIFGKIMGRKSEEKHAIAKAEHKKRLMAAHDEDDEDERSFPGIVVKHNNQEDPDIIIAVISMAIKEYLDDTHDVESGIITIMPKENTKWTRT